MKKILTFACLSLTLSLSSIGQNTMNISYNDGTMLLIDMDDVARVYFTSETPGSQEWVDLGLSVSWAACNVGAFSPQEPGYRYAWGETMPNGVYDSFASRWWALPSSALIAKSVTGEKLTLSESFDAACRHWRGEWRMPTREEAEELINLCSWTYTQLGGYEGYEVTGPNGRSIFIPANTAAGAEGWGIAESLFWTSTADAADANLAYCVMAGENRGEVRAHHRFLGQSARAVCPVDYDARYPAALYIMGSATPRGWEAAGTKLVKQAPGIYTYQGPLAAGELKAFANSPADWSGEFYRPAVDQTAITFDGLSSSPMELTASPDKKWLVTDAWEYRLTFDLTNMTLTAEAVNPPVQPIARVSELYLVGSAAAGGWNLGDAVAFNSLDPDNYIFTWTGYLKAGELKLSTSLSQSFADPFVRPADAGAEISAQGLSASPIAYADETDGDKKWAVADAGIYSITVDLVNASISASYLGAVPEELMIVGSATTAEWDLDSACEFYQEPAGSYRYVWAGDLTEGELKAMGSRLWSVPFIRPLDGGMEISHDGAGTPYFTYSAAPDDKWYVTEPGRYRLTFDLPRGIFTAEYLGETIHRYNAPLYWSVYQYCYTREKARAAVIDIDAEQWDEFLDWAAANLKPAGYDMVCTDGFCSMMSFDGSGYMSRYGSVDLATLVAKCRARGLKLGIYDNPLWLHDVDEKLVPSTDYTFGSLKYNPETDNVLHPDNEDMWFKWVVSSHPGAKEYIDGFFKHYHDLGVEYIRMDFMSWYEDGTDRGLDIVGHGYGRDNYIRALQYIAEAADRYGIFVSFVMPHLYNNANVERHTGQMTRIVADTQDGGWWHTSGDDRGVVYPTWPNCKNQFDGFAHWSSVSGRGNMILDGDFLLIGSYNTAAEKETAVSLQVVAGGPVTVADLPDSFDQNDLQYYTNPEILALNADGFVGKPHPDYPDIWTGQMSNGDWIVAYFNRTDSWQNPTISFADLGIEGNWRVRQLWSRQEVAASASSYTDWVQDHGCRILRLSR